MTSLSLLEAARDPASAGRVALIAGDRERRFADLGPPVAAFCERLLARGIGPGARAALIAHNSVEAAIAIYALFELGVTLVPIHPRLTQAEVSALLEDGSADVVLREADIADINVDRDRASDPSPLLDRIRTSAACRAPEALGAIVHTSGTTGRPKGAMLSRGAILASAEQSASNLGFFDDDRWLLCMPICHIGGLSILTRCLLSRAAVILPSHASSRFDPHAVIDAARRRRATLISVVPTMLRDMLDADANGALAGLRAALVGGAAAPIALLDECASRGVRALTTYGLTEACSQVTAQSPRSSLAVLPGSGKALSCVSLRVARDDGEDAVPFEVGRIQIRGPVVMRGYWSSRPSDALADPPHVPAPIAGWFDTGDIGALDVEGHLHVHARRTDLIVTGGENVYPVEIEQAIELCPGVARALVFGVPDDRWGQIVAAAVVLDPARPADKDALFAELGARLAPHKRPRRACFVDSLPLTSSGKLDRASALKRLAPLLRPSALPGRAPGDA